MTSLLSLTARALVDHCLEHPRQDIAAACDAALEFLTRQGCPPAAFGKLVPLVAKELRRRGDTALLRTARPIAAEQEKHITAALVQSLGKPVELTKKEESSLIGGAVLEVRDDRIDASVRGILDDLQEHMTLQSSFASLV